ncbi:MAG: undecaprenyl/decaprenyl-phosphate alpha-N-acetylglucosaminyl 1-phosphate transferase [Armatimonadetes bacterium]|nr:undecaprenyl/decaprenyl-phosphate alpha-N-acetylglucosaminyl 1-phosphate transferase [Armatimonadota bacterium]MDE2206782.1 undecaprenyl/decaprenyl-phosphate alpha-N-acetylglucosaminyl 1-phosphate transferase [Armatimonadota bacterium]
MARDAPYAEAQHNQVRPAPVVAAFAVTLLISSVLTRLMIRIAHSRGWLSEPTEDRWGKSRTALYGGVAMVSAYFAGAAILLRPLIVGAHWDLVGLLIGGLLIGILGLRDDIRALDPQVKMLGQVMCVTPFLVGIGLTDPSPVFLFSMPVVLFWMVSHSNLFNLIDNMDGLSGGTAAIVGLVLAAYCYVSHTSGSRVGLPGDLGLLVSATALGFLIFNFRPRRPAAIWMGDSGSMFLGYMLGGVVVEGVSATAHDYVGAIVLPLIIMALPIFDGALVIVTRKRAHRRISQGGRDHSSHRMVYAGLTEKQAVLTSYAISMLAGGSAVALQLLHSPHTTVVVAGLIAVLLCWFGVFLSRVRLPAAVTAPGS